MGVPQDLEKMCEEKPSSGHLVLERLCKRQADIEQWMNLLNARRNNTCTEIYHILGFYFLFHCILLVTLFTAKPDTKTINSWWTLFVLCTLGGLGTVWSVLHKISADDNLRRMSENEVEDFRAVGRCIQSLLCQGAQ
eukprot:Gb_35605 [translate_table: standard]